MSNVDLRKKTFKYIRKGIWVNLRSP